MGSNDRHLTLKGIVINLTFATTLFFCFQCNTDRAVYRMPEDGVLHISADEMNYDGISIHESSLSDEGEAITFEKEGDRAYADIYLQKGIYQLKTSIHGIHESHDAVRVSIAGKDWRFYHSDSEKFGIARSNIPNIFSIHQDSIYRLNLSFLETGVEVGWIEISTGNWPDDPGELHGQLGSVPITVSTYESISVYWKPDFSGKNESCSMHYRPAGTQSWKRAQDLWYDDISNHPYWQDSYRGSIVCLRPGTRYEIKLTLESGESETVMSGTWSEKIPVKKIIHLKNTDQAYCTSEGGSKNAYVVYDGNYNTIDVGNRSESAFTVAHSYVVIQNLILRGGLSDGLVVKDSIHDVIIQNNDISQWGSFRKKALNKNSPGWGFRGDAAIEISPTSSRVVIQGNRLHDPAYGTNTWQEDGHPDGPTAIFCEKGTVKGNHVIRYNEIYSDDLKPFEDGMMGRGNFGWNGFPGPDSDIYGNYIGQSTDNGIEAEGGGMNVRIWNNYLEDHLVGIATASVTLGPLYLFRNVCGNTISLSRADRFLKIGGDEESSVGAQFIYHNSMLSTDSRGAVSGTAGGPRNTVTRNNIFLGNDFSFRNIDHPENDFDYDLVYGPLQIDSAFHHHSLKGLLPVWRDGHGPGSGRNGKYQLAPSSPGFDAGVLLPNFNEDYTGEAPDMGAHEANRKAMKFGLDAWDGYRERYH